MKLPIGYEERKNAELRDLGIQDPENYDVLPNGIVRRRVSDATVAAATPEKMSALEAGARSFVGALPETAGGILGAAGAGALAGTLGAGPVGTILGGLAGAFAGSYAGGKAEEAVAPQAYIDWQREAEEQRPLAAAVGSLAAQVPFMRPGIQPLRQASRMLRTGMRATAPQIESALNVGIGAGVGGAGSVASDVLAGRDIDWQRAALETGAGAFLNTPTRLTTWATRGRFRPDTYEEMPEDILQRHQNAPEPAAAPEVPPARVFTKHVMDAIDHLGFREKYNLSDDNALASFMDGVLKIVKSPEKTVQGKRTSIDKKIRTLEDNLGLMDEGTRAAAEAELSQLKVDRAMLDDAFKLRGLVDEFDAIVKPAQPALPAPAEPRPRTVINVTPRPGDMPPAPAPRQLPEPPRQLPAPAPAPAPAPQPDVAGLEAAVARANKRAAEIAQATEQQRIAREAEQLIKADELVTDLSKNLQRPEASPETFRANMRVGKSNAAAAAESAADLEARRIEARLAGESRPGYQAAEPEKPGFVTPAEADTAREYGRTKMGTKVRFRDKVTTRGPEPVEVRGRNVGRPTPVDLALADVSATRGTGDTPYHELLHQLIRDIRSGGDARENKLVDTMLRGAGDEEALVQAAGEDFYRRMVDKKSSSFLRDFSDMIRTRFGSRDPGVAARQLSAGMRYGRGAAERGLGPDAGAIKAPPMKAAETEEKTQPLEGDVFEFAPKREFNSERPFGLTIANDGTLPVQNLIAKLDKTLNRGDRELLRFAGFDRDFADKTRVDVKKLRKWIADNEPKVEVKELLATGNMTPEQLELATLTHDWYDNLPQKVQAQLQSVLNNEGRPDIQKRILRGIYKENQGDSDIRRESVDRYLELRRITDKQPKARGANDSATRRFERVNPRELEDMPGAVDLLVKIPRRDYGTADQVKESTGQFPWKQGSGKVWDPVSKTYRDPALYSTYHYPDSGDNLLTHVRAYEHELPDGRRVLRVFELQSDWAQARRKLVDKIKERIRQGNDGKFYFTERGGHSKKFDSAAAALEHGLSEYTDTADHPLLEHTNRLGLKAAIEHARKRGLDGVVIDDADTVMLTEGHDRVRTRTMQPEDIGFVEPDLFEHYFGNDWRSGKYVEFRNEVYRVDKPELNPPHQSPEIARELAPYWGTDKHYIPQRGGMELNYNKLLPAAMADLTGKTPQRVNLGEHKNAVNTTRERIPGTNTEPEDSPLDLSQVRTVTTPREDLTIKNPDGTPKTESTGLMFALGDAAERRATGEPFTLTGARYQPLGPTEHGLNPNARRLSRNIFSSAVDNLRAAGTPEAKYTADGLQKLYNTERSYRGRYETPIAETLAPLNDKQKRTLLEEMYNGRDGSRLGGQTRQAYAAIRTTLRQIALDQIAAGQRVEDSRGKLRPRKVDPNYFPNVINHDALRILTENVGSPEYAKLRKDFIDYNTSRGVYNADKIFERLSSALNKSQRPNRGGIEFNAMRMIESSKLPPSWMETDLDMLMRRYVNRVAKDRAFFDVVEKDHALSAHIGEDVYMQDQPVDKTLYKPIGGINEVRQLLDSYRGENARDDQFIRSFGRLINAAILSGPKTRLTDLATTPIKALAYAPSGERLRALTKGVSDLVNNWAGVRGAAMRTGFIRPGDQIVRTEVLGMGERAAKGMDKAAEMLVKYTGSEAIERGSRVVAQALGEAIGVAWKQRALRGDARAMKFMDKLGSDWRTIADAELGTRVGQLFQGRYDAVNLPRWAIDSDVAPFFAMARWNIEQFNNFKKFALDSLLKDKDPAMLIAQVVAGVAGGLGISELRDYITGREGYTATFKEIAEAPDKQRAAEELASKLAEAAAVTGTVGIMGEIMKQAYDVYQKKLPQGFRYPALSVATDVFSKATSMVDAILDGEDILAVALQGGHDIIFQNVQALRFAEEQSARLGGPGAEERDRKIGRRDYQMFTRLGGYDVKAPPIGAPAYRSLSEREFDRETDPAAAAAQARTLVREAYVKAAGDPSKLMAELRKLRTSQITFAPSLQNDPVRFMKYADYVERVRGKEAKEKLLSDYQKAAALRQFKSALVPR